MSKRSDADTELYTLTRSAYLSVYSELLFEDYLSCNHDKVKTVNY